MADNVNEEHFMFIAHGTAREVISAALNSSGDTEPIVELEMRTPRVGTVSVREGETYILFPVTLHEMPTLIETFKSHNHINLIKAGDIGQAFIVHDLLTEDDNPTPELLARTLEANLEQLMRMEAEGELPDEAQCGITPPMVAGCASMPQGVASVTLALCRSLSPENRFGPGDTDCKWSLMLFGALKRVESLVLYRSKAFRRKLNPKPELVTEVEEQLLALMHGEAPEGWVIEDTAEIYLDGKGWVALSDAPPEHRKHQAPDKEQDNKDRS